jgi:hypothetical protein
MRRCSRHSPNTNRSGWTDHVCCAEGKLRASLFPHKCVCVCGGGGGGRVQALNVFVMFNVCFAS